MKSSHASVDSSLAGSRSNKSLSQANQRIIKKKSGILPEDLDPMSLNMVELKKENEELKIMELSDEARENLKKLQRFDRFIYAGESEKILKKPIEQ